MWSTEGTGKPKFLGLRKFVLCVVNFLAAGRRRARELLSHDGMLKGPVLPLSSRPLKKWQAYNSVSNAELCPFVTLTSPGVSTGIPGG